MCGALKLSGIVRANFRLNIAIAMLFLSLSFGPAALFWPLFGASECSPSRVKNEKSVRSLVALHRRF